METKIIKVVFGGRRYAVTNKRTRTDYGQMFEFVDITLPDTFEVIFSNSSTSAGTGKKMIGSNQRCLIPDEYLATGQPIYAWILLHDTEDDGRHMYSIKSPVDDMPDTSPEEPTPVEQSVISQAITALNSAVTTTTQKAQEATESADRAEQAAEGVEGYAERAEAAQGAAESARDIALEAKVSAQASAATASEKASEAINSATTASQSALTAENASESASASADASAQSALRASQFAVDASVRAHNASEYAQTASGYASNANTSAQTASQKALEASQSASTAVQAKTDAETAKTASQTAQGRAESARDDAVTAKTSAESARDEAQNIADGITGKVEQIDSNTDRIESLEDDRYKPYPTDTASGSIASFPDGADGIPLKSCIVQIEPVQDLHGQDSPYPAGGGKNIFDPSKYTVVSSGNNRISLDGETYTMTWSNGAIVMRTKDVQEFEAGDYAFIGNGTNLNYLTAFAYAVSDNHTIMSKNLLSGATFTATEPFYIAINGNYEHHDTAVFNFQLERSTTIHPWSPYENICPISGWTGCEVQRTGKNLANAKFGTKVPSISNGQMVNVSGWSTEYIKVDNSKTYSASAANDRSSYVFYYDHNLNYLGSRIFAKYVRVDTESYFSGASYIKLRNDAGESDNPQIQLELGSTATDYAPYTGQAYPITFPSEAGTVYGGYIDPINGELVVDRAIRTITAFTGTWGATSNGFAVFDTAPGGERISTADVVSNMFTKSANGYSTMPTWSFVGGNGIRTTITFVLGNGIASKAEADAFAASNPIQYTYYLAEPIRYSLANMEIKTLLGQNNLWADTGDVSVEYRADTRLYIGRLTEPDADMIADSNITSGSYFMVGNNLYLATANIASGASVIVGTNAVKVSLAQALNEINQ